MTKNNTHWLSPIFTFLGFSNFFILVMLVIFFTTSKGDAVIWFAENRNPVLNILFLWLTRLGEEHIFLLAIIVFLFVSYRKSALFSLAGVVSLVLSFIAKSIFQQPRPLAYFSDKGIPELMGNIDGYSFHIGMTSMPSGHTMAAFAFFTIIAFIFNKTYIQIAAVLLAASAGISRIYLGQHFILDVVVGALFGIGIGILSWYIVYIVWEDRKNMDASLIRRFE